MRLDDAPESDNVEDRRGMKPAMVAGGGLGGLLILAVAYFFTGDAQKAKEIADKVGGNRDRQEEVSGPAPKDGELQFSKKIMGLTDEVWTEQFKTHGSRRGLAYEKPQMVLFAEAVDTKCGHAPSAVGPFYCPADKKVYLDPTFFAELEKKLGGSKADFSKAYVIAHEVGHHVQNLLEYNDLVDKFKPREGDNAGIRLELQADYLAGVCWHHVNKKHPNIIERGDVEEALKSAKAIGDDKIQGRGGAGRVRPDTFTHGSAAQRLKFFREGLQTGDASKQALDRFFDPKVDPLKL